MNPRTRTEKSQIRWISSPESTHQCSNTFAPTGLAVPVGLLPDMWPKKRGINSSSAVNGGHELSRKG